MSAASTSAILRHIPSELLKEILLNLPIKSLLRFSSVSKSWHSMISESRFVREHIRRAAVNGVERMFTVPLNADVDKDISVYRIPHTSSTVIDVSTHLICPIEKGQPHLRAFCDGLWLVEAKIFRQRLHVWSWRLRFRFKKSLYLWNPSTRTHRKLPDSPLPTNPFLPRWIKFVYGLGYDSAADDYKVLKIAREGYYAIPTQLYSLKSDSWKTISFSPPPPGLYWQERCEYLNGSFHWIPTSGNTIVTFNLSTEKCGEIMLPAISLDPDWKYVEVVVLKGKLCVSVNNSPYNPVGFRFAFWVMEEYGVEKSWTEVLNTEYVNDFSPVFHYGHAKLKPVHFYNNGDMILVNEQHVGLCMYKNEAARLEKIVARDGSSLRGGFTYVESLVSPLPVVKSRHSMKLMCCF